MMNVPRRLKKVGDLWEPLLAQRPVFASNPSYESAIRKKFPPMEANRRQTFRQVRSGTTNRSGWGFFSAAWHFAIDDRIELLSKSQKPLTRYFPELVAELSSLKAKKICTRRGNRDFPRPEAVVRSLLMRIHPAESRIRNSAKRRRASLSSSICWLTSRASRQLISRFANDDVTRVLCQEIFHKGRLDPVVADDLRSFYRAQVVPHGSRPGRYCRKREDLPYQSGKRTECKRSRNSARRLRGGGLRGISKRKNLSALYCSDFTMTKVCSTT